MKTIDLSNAKELQSVCKDKNITMPESYFFYVPFIGRVIDGQDTGIYYGLKPRDEIGNPLPVCIYHAYTLDELMERLPKSIEFITNIEYIKSLQWDNINNTWSAGYMNYEDWHCYQNDPNPANATCKLLIWLIKEGLM